MRQWCNEDKRRERDLRNARGTEKKGAITDPLFVEHYWRLARRPAKWAARWVAFKMRKIGVPARARVLDIGCGPGWLVRFLSERFSAMRFVALDASEPMVVQARGQRGDESERGRVCFLVGDGCRLPFRSGHFDLVISGATLHHVADPVALFNEIDRVVVSGGCVIVSDLNGAVPRLVWPLVALADWIERRLRPAAARQLPESIANSFRAAYTNSEIRRFLSESTLGRRVRYDERMFQHWIQTPARHRGTGAPPIKDFSQGLGHDVR